MQFVILAATNKITMGRIAKVLIVVFVSIVADQGTKVWAKSVFKGQGESCYMDRFFCWIFAENEGAFLGWGSELEGIWNILLLKLLPILLILGLFYMTLFSKDLLKNQIVPFSMILGGGLSNLFDRIAFGKVVDFMNMGLGDLRTGIFNVADMVILAGIIWYFFSNFGKREEAMNQTEATPENIATEGVDTNPPA